MDTGKLPGKDLRSGRNRRRRRQRGICEWGSSPRPLAGRRAVRGKHGGCQTDGEETPKGLALRVGGGLGEEMCGLERPSVGSDRGGPE